jgi:hypothetical protein
MSLFEFCHDIIELMFHMFHELAIARKLVVEIRFGIDEQFVNKGQASQIIAGGPDEFRGKLDSSANALLSRQTYDTVLFITS